MAKLTLEEIQEIRENKKREIEARLINKDKIQVVVGMGTTGIKAGAKEILKTFHSEFQKRKMYEVILRQSGGEEIYGVEPVVEIYIPEMGSVKYKSVTPELVNEIIDKHIKGKTILMEHIHREPA